MELKQILFIATNALQATTLTQMEAALDALVIVSVVLMMGFVKNAGEVSSLMRDYANHARCFAFNAIQLAIVWIAL